MADQDKSDSRSWQLGKQKERDNESRFKLEEETKAAKKPKVRAPKKDPTMRESIVAPDRPSGEVEEEDDDRPIVPIGKPIVPKAKKPWTAQRVIKHPVTIILTTVIICASILNTLLPNLDSNFEPNPYALVYDEQKPGVALVNHFLYSEEQQNILDYALGYDEPLAIREGRFLVGVGEIFSLVGKARSENKPVPLFPSVTILTEIPIVEQTDPNLLYSQGLQNSERIESIKDLAQQLNKAVSEYKIDPKEFQAIGEQLQLKGKALLDSFVEDPKLRTTLAVDKANEQLAGKSFPEFSSFNETLSKSLHPDFYAALLAAHNRYY
ncbi:MAG: hypothetical protein ACFCU1_14215 [Sumerlaeia bacterium]